MRVSNFFLFLARVAMGWIMLYSGITKIIDPSWTSAGYIKGARTFSGFYRAIANSGFLPAVDFINEWGLTLLGVSLILGIFVRLSSTLGGVLMLLYYFPILNGFYPNPHSLLVDEHIIYALVLFYFAVVRAGRVWGLEEKCSKLPICSRFSAWRALLG